MLQNTTHRFGDVFRRMQAIAAVAGPDADGMENRPDINVDAYLGQLRRKFPEASISPGSFHPGRIPAIMGTRNVFVSESLLEEMARDPTVRHCYERMITAYLVHDGFRFETSRRQGLERLSAGIVLTGSGDSVYEAMRIPDNHPATVGDYAIRFRSIDADQLFGA